MAHPVSLLRLNSRTGAANGNGLDQRWWTALIASLILFGPIASPIAAATRPQRIDRVADDDESNVYTSDKLFSAKYDPIVDARRPGRFANRI